MKQVQAREQVKELKNDLEAERARKRDYYHNHRDKIQESAKVREASKMAEVLKEHGLPLFLAPYIRFHKESKYKKDRLTLNFDSKVELVHFIQQVKFESDITVEELSDLIMKFQAQ